MRIVELGRARLNLEAILSGLWVAFYPAMVSRGIPGDGTALEAYRIAPFPTVCCKVPLHEDKT